MYRGWPPSQGWRTFLTNHVDGIAAIDLFVMPTITFRLLYCLVILRHGRRLWVSFGVTTNPTAEWISRQITEAVPWDSSPRYLIRDRDTAYGLVFRQRLRAMGIRDKPTAPRSPWQNPYVERLIGTIRRECLDHMIVFGEAHLRRILGRYAAYYNESRIHRSLDKDAPFHRAIERFGVITSQPVLGGLHHQYCRILIFGTHRVEDSWHENYEVAPTDGSAWLRGGDPSFRVVRGGSWRNESELVRAAVRFRRHANVQFDTLGFRVARTIKP